MHIPYYLSNVVHYTTAFLPKCLHALLIIYLFYCCLHISLLTTNTIHVQFYYPSIYPFSCFSIYCLSIHPCSSTLYSFFFFIKHTTFLIPRHSSATSGTPVLCSIILLSNQPIMWQQINLADKCRQCSHQISELKKCDP